MFAALAAGAIFSATASAASVPVATEVPELVETSSAVIAAPVDIEPELSTELTASHGEAEVSEIEEVAAVNLDFAAIDALSAEALTQLREIDSLALTLANESSATNRSLAVDVESIESLIDLVNDEPVVEAADEPVADAAPVALEELPVEVLSESAEQAAAGRAAAEQAAGANPNLSVGERAAVLARELGTPADEASAQAAWDAGYLLGGGANLSSFHNTIIPCESGGQPNRDSVVGFTDDWGRAQINRPVWSSTFGELTGVAFEEGVVLPALNGYMAAHIEQVQGLSAWTCWRNR